MIDATKEMFTKYCVFSGRTSRANFWWAILGYIILTMIVGIIAGIIIGGNTTDINSSTNIISYIWSLGTLLPLLGMEARRLHDINKSAWFLLLLLVPFVGSIVLLVFFCLPAVDKDNSY